MADSEAEIDRLYQLPLDAFTPARNALAKTLKQPALKELQKPSVPAWAVNQLYWRHRAVFDRLTSASEALRAEHRKMLAGKAADVAAAERSHRDVMREAAEIIRGLLAGADQAATPATLGAIHETLQALPSSDPPGRLTRPLKPLGFEALAGVSVQPGRPPMRVVARGPAQTPDEAPSETDAARERRRRQEEEAAAARQKRQREAEQALKAAETAMLEAEAAVKAAEKALQSARAARDAAVSEYQRARLRAHE